MNLSATHLESKPIILYLPQSYPLDSSCLQFLQQDNPEVLIKIHDDHSIEILEHKFSFYLEGSFPIKFAGLTDSVFDEIHDLNEELNLEFYDNEEVIIKMGVIRMISKLTAAIISSFFVWASKNKTGEVYSENGEYRFPHPAYNKKKIRKIPDVSFISYHTASEEEQDNWSGFIPIPPNMALEIVSAKNGLKKDMKKMAEFWMPSGVDVGLVVCPYSEKIYIYEKGKTGYKTQSIFKDFSHKFLPGYKDNFGKYLKKR